MVETLAVEVRNGEFDSPSPLSTKTVRKTFKYRLYPNKQQERTLNDWCFVCSLVYNRCLEKRIKLWKEEQKSVSAYDQQKDIAAWAKEDVRIDNVYAQVRNEVAIRLDRAYQAFFQRVNQGSKPGFPRFQRARHYDSFTFTQSGFQLTEKHLRLSKVGNVKIKLHRPVGGQIRQLTIRRKAGQWFACFSCEAQAQAAAATGLAVGLDVGIEYLVTTSDGQHFENPKYQKRLQTRLRRQQRVVSRRKKGSKRRLKAIRLLERTHDRIVNQRNDTAHKVSRDIVNRYDLVVVEDLSITNMVKNHHLANSISDAAWGRLISLLEQKADETGRTVVRVDPRNTSQMCNRCGTVVKKTLSERQHKCEHCGEQCHRDVNAAINILQRGMSEHRKQNRSGQDLRGAVSSK